MDFLFTASFFKTLLLSVIIFIFLDMAWLGLVASNLYRQQLGYLATLKNNRIVFNLPVGLATQAIIAIGLAVMIRLTYQLDPRLVTTIGLGALTGFVIYATYDLTNYSFIKDWPLKVTLIDIIWGTLQGSMAGVYVYYLTKFFS